jgi:hypothetical protein
MAAHISQHKTIPNHFNKKGLKSEIKNPAVFFIGNPTCGHDSINTAVCGV